MQLLVTGGCGFIGTGFIRMILRERPEISLVNLDALTYAGNPANLEDVARTFPNRYRFVHADITDAQAINAVLEAQTFDAILNFAAESHVDRSIVDATPFVHTNVLGVQVLLDAARRACVKRYVQISTDEVYGTLGPEGRFSETTPLAPNSPYSASKAGADLLVRAAHETFGLDTIITRCSNNYGPYQFPEKLIPFMIRRALADEALPVYGDGMQIRDWIHVEDHCRGILRALEHGRSGAVYNFGGNAEIANMDVVHAVLRLLDKPEGLIRHVEDRPGHDRRYAMDYTLAATELGYAPSKTFADGLAETVHWYLDHQSWVDNVVSGEYRKFIDTWYENR